MQRVTVTIQRLGAKSLGFQVATAAGFVYVKAVSAEPAVSADLRVDDRIISVSFIDVITSRMSKVLSILISK